MKKLKRPIAFRWLSEEGEKELGAIFPVGVPVVWYAPDYAKLQGSPNPADRVFLVDWHALSDEQKEQSVSYMSNKFDAPAAQIWQHVEQVGNFPIRAELLIESYELGHLITEYGECE